MIDEAKIRLTAHQALDKLTPTQCQEFLLGQRGQVLPRILVGAFIVNDEQILFGRSNKGAEAGHWTLPTGRINPFETVQAATQRMLREQTGVEAKIGGCLFVKEQVTPTNHRIVIYSRAWLQCDWLRAGGDLSELHWMNAAAVELAFPMMTALTVGALTTLAELPRDATGLPARPRRDPAARAARPPEPPDPSRRM